MEHFLKIVLTDLVTLRKVTSIVNCVVYDFICLFCAAVNNFAFGNFVQA